MNKPIYFTKIEFRECIGYIRTRSIMLLNTVKKELSYQVFDWKRQMPAVQVLDSIEWDGKMEIFEKPMPARVVKSSKTGFKSQLIPVETNEQKIVFSYALKLSEEEMERILPYCNALDFEPYRDKEMSMKDKGFIGYRDEVQLHFTAISDSYIPKLELPMTYYYDKEHTWPSEKLYRFLVATYFENKKKLGNWGPTYGGCSLFF